MDIGSLFLHQLFKKSMINIQKMLQKVKKEIHTFQG